jgi:hypothetical protein
MVVFAWGELSRRSAGPAIKARGAYDPLGFALISLAVSLWLLGWSGAFHTRTAIVAIFPLVFSLVPITIYRIREWSICGGAEANRLPFRFRRTAKALRS